MSEVFAEVAGFRAAIRELGERGLIRVTGGDRVRFLNGMVTADVSSLGTGSACHSLQLDRKGHILAELWVLVLDDAMLLDSAPETESALLEALEKHLIADDVELRGVSGWDQIGIEGPDAAAAIEAEIARVPEPGCFERDASGRIWIAGGSLGEGARVLGERAAIEELRHALQLPGLSGEACEVLRIDAFRPAHVIDFGQRNFPQEARLEASVSFTKGCYIGQEIVARIESRGAVNRFLVKLRPELPVAAGAEVRSDGVAVGRITSSASSGATGPIALGYLRKSHVQPGCRVEIDGVAATVADTSEPTPR